MINSKYQNDFDNIIIVKNYKTFNDHYRKIVIVLNDDNRTIEYKFTDHIIDK